jgi:hypothetical protein
MFNKDGFKKIGEDIYVYENFVSKSDCEDILEEIKKIKEDEWFNLSSELHSVSKQKLEKIKLIREKIESILEKDYFVGFNTNPVRMKAGAVWGEHSDDADFKDIVEASKQYKSEEDFDLADNTQLGLIVYFNDFEGGEVYYPNQNIEYAPKSGDLLIHSAFEHCTHGVKEVISGTRYSYSNHIFNQIKVPKGYNFFDSQSMKKNDI